MNILFIGGDGNRPNANSVCVNNMAREMMRRGHKVWILAMGEEYIHEAGTVDGAELWQVPDDYYGRLIQRTTACPTLLRRLWFKVFSTVRHLVIMPTYPDAAPWRSRKVARMAKELVNKNNIKLVVAIFNCYENINAGMELKRQYGDKIRVVSYHLDLRTASINPSALVRNYIYKKAMGSLIQEIQIVDKMLIPYSGQKDIESLTGKVAVQKIHFVGFPVFISSTISEKSLSTECDVPFEKDAINISYIGSMSADNRNPQYVLSLLEKVQGRLGRKVIVHFWGDDGGLKSMIEESPVAVYHGKVDNSFVRYLMGRSDFLLNLGNVIAYDMLPSKVFGMFATGKPIINVIGHPDDATLPFFERYAHSIDIREYEHELFDTERLAESMRGMLNSPLRESEGLFDDFKPERLCGIILNNDNEK